MSIVRKEDKPVFRSFSQSSNFSTGIVTSKPRTAIRIEKPIVPVKKKVKITSFADVLEECVKKGVVLPESYHSPCGGRCPNGLIGTRFLNFHLRFGHDTVTAALIKQEINVPDTDDSICPECRENHRDHSWLAYHLAEDHKYDLEKIIQVLRGKTTEKYKEIEEPDKITDQVSRIGMNVGKPLTASRSLTDEQ